MRRTTVHNKLVAGTRWPFLLALAVGLLAFAGTTRAESLRVNGSTTVNPIVSEAAEILRAEKGMSILVDTQGGSSGGIASLGDHRADVGMASRPLNEGDRKKFPGVDFRPVAIGFDALAIVVSSDVWEGGVQALSKEQILGLYEGRVKNWKQVGGPDRRVVFFNKEPGRGTWEVFADWLYGDANQAPMVNLPEVGANEEARTKIRSTRGSITQLSASWADGKNVHALGIRRPDGTVIRPTADNVATGAYPLGRSLFMITDGEPKGGAKTLLDFLLGPRGQKLVTKHGFLPLADRVAGEGEPED